MLVGILTAMCTMNTLFSIGSRSSSPPPPRASEIYPRFFELLPSQTGKVIAVTGASRGLGYVTALSLAKKGATVYLLSRKSERAHEALASIAAAATGPSPVLIECDLLEFASVRSAAAQLREHATDGLDVLCLNAGIMMQPDEASSDGYDITISTNVLSQFLLTRELMPELEKAASAGGGGGEARVVCMSSGSGFGPPALDVTYFARAGGRLGGQRTSYERYHQSKLANLLFTSSLDERLRARGSAVKAVACTPGVCGTDMFVHVSRLSGRAADLSRVPSAEDGACAQLKAICDPAVHSGELWGPPGLGGPPKLVAIAPPTVLVDADAKERLWACCERAVGAFDL